MNKFIKKELEKCRIKLPEYNDDTTYLFIPRNEDVKNLEELKINHFYLFEVADYIINEPPTFTLSANWNGGTYPPEKRLNCEVLEFVGKMVKVLSEGETTHIRWEGFLPRKSIKMVLNNKVLFSNSIRMF